MARGLPGGRQRPVGDRCRVYWQSNFGGCCSHRLRDVGIRGRAHLLDLPTGFLTGSAAAGGIALINSIGNLGGFVGPYAIGWIKDATGETTLGLVVLATGLIMAGVVTFLMGHDAKMEMAGSRPSRFTNPAKG